MQWSGLRVASRPATSLELELSNTARGGASNKPKKEPAQKLTPLLRVSQMELVTDPYTTSITTQPATI